MALYPLASVCKEPGGTYLKARVDSLMPFSPRELIPLQAQQTHQVYYAGLCSLKQRINCHIVIDSTVLQATIVAQAGKHERLGDLTRRTLDEDGRLQHDREVFDEYPAMTLE